MTANSASTAQRPRYATLREAAEYCRSTRRTLERRIAEGKLTRFRNGFRVLVDLNEIDAMLRGRGSGTNFKTQGMKRGTSLSH